MLQGRVPAIWATVAIVAGSLAGCSDAATEPALSSGTIGVSIGVDLGGPGGGAADAVAWPDASTPDDAGPGEDASVEGCTSDEACEGQVAAGTCERAFCDLATGVCAVAPEDDGAACDDGNPCTADDACTGGSCGGGGPASCDDGDPCTSDSCDPATGCAYEPNAAPCDDGDACTAGDQCAGGQCHPGAAITCPDGGTCELSWCDPGSGCQVGPAQDGHACDDGFPCTEGESCLDGVCGGGVNTCPACESNDDCETSVDPCVGAVVCDTVVQECVLDETAAPDCAGVLGPCATEICQSETGACVVLTEPDGSACAGDDPCSQVGSCQAGACDAPVFDCDDANPCTADSCDPATGQCAHTPIEGACDDGDACTIGDACTDGACLGAGVVPCDDGDNCTADGCDPVSGCTVTPLSCDDGDACTVDACDPATGACIYEGLTCPAATGVCTVSVCNPADGSCLEVTADDGAACNDGDPCTVGDACSGGVCGASALDDCDDGKGCTVDSCVPGVGCQHDPFICPQPESGCEVAICVDATGECANAPVADGKTCEDSNPCTVNDVCVGPVCTAGETICDCTTDADCEDGWNWCLGTPICDAASGVCLPQAGTAVTCTDPGPCEVGVCEPATGDCGVTAVEDGVSCDDGDPCTAVDTCAAGVCVGTPLDCPDPGPCLHGVCDKTAGACAGVPVADGLSCEDGDVCTQDDSCLAGLCLGGPPACDCQSDGDCLDGANLCDGVPLCDLATHTCVPDPASAVVCAGTLDDCNDEVCEPATGTCIVHAKPEGWSCHDAGPCFGPGVCLDGTCEADPVVCPETDDPCFERVCDPASGDCVVADLDGPCDDGDPCTPESECVGGQCEGIGGIECDDGNPCTIDACTAGAGCHHTPLGEQGACDDGNPCTVDDACVGGTCIGAYDDCDDGDDCTLDWCDGGCQHEEDPNCNEPDECEGIPAAAACDDGDPGTTGDICFAGSCRGFHMDAVVDPEFDDESARLIAVDFTGNQWVGSAQLLGPWLAGVGVLVGIDDPGNPWPYFETWGYAQYTDIRSGHAVDTSGWVWRRQGGGEWTANHALGEAIAASGQGALNSIWRFQGTDGAHTWVLGTTWDGNDEYIRHCVEAANGDSWCEPQYLPAGGSAVPLAVAGRTKCESDDACTQAELVAPSDADGPGNSWYNDIYVNWSGHQQTWSTEFYDTGEQDMGSRGATGWGNGHYLVVGTNGYMRYRAPGGAFSNQLSEIKDGMWLRQFEAAWTGGGAILVAAWRNTGGSVDLELWTCPTSADPTNGASWSVHWLGTVGSGGGLAGLFDVWGRATGHVRLVGGGVEDWGSTVHALVFARDP